MYTRANTFTDDILYQIMLFLSIKDIKSLCMTDMDANQLCNSKQFWADKMAREHIPLLDVSMAGYETLKPIYDDMIENIKESFLFPLTERNEKYEYRYNPYEEANQSKNIIKLLPQRLIHKLSNRSYTSMTINHFAGDYYMIKVWYENYDNDNLSIRKGELIDFLVNVFYLYPSIKPYK